MGYQSWKHGKMLIFAVMEFNVFLKKKKKSIQITARRNHAFNSV